MRKLAKLSMVLAAVVATLGMQTQLHAQDKVLNLYSARHYATDQIIYDTFSRTTGIRINLVEANDAGIVARLRAEGAASPADVVLLVDAARLALADSQGLFQPIRSANLDAAIPAHLRAARTADGVTWTGFSTRARVLAFDPQRVRAEDVATYEQLADPRFRGMLCTRSGSHPYNLSLIATVIERMGDAKGEAWLRGLVANFARAPVGGDTDQIRAVAAGECAVAITNSYYAARLMRSANAADRAVMERVRISHPNQASTGTHVNIAGGAVARHAPNREHAIAFMEFLATPFAQAQFADSNNEYPTAIGVPFNNPALTALGGGDQFKRDTIALDVVARNLVRVQQMLDRVGFK